MQHLRRSVDQHVELFTNFVPRLNRSLWDCSQLSMLGLLDLLRLGDIVRHSWNQLARVGKSWHHTRCSRHAVNAIVGTYLVDFGMRRLRVDTTDDRRGLPLPGLMMPPYARPMPSRLGHNGFQSLQDKSQWRINQHKHCIIQNAK